MDKFGELAIEIKSDNEFDSCITMGSIAGAACSGKANHITRSGLQMDLKCVLLTLLLVLICKNCTCQICQLDPTSL